MALNFVDDKLDLLFFLNTRNRIKFNCHEAIRSYIQRRKALYYRQCDKERPAETATTKKFRHVLGLDKPSVWCGARLRPLKYTRDLTKARAWSLAPNRYDVPQILYESKQGASGAHWAKLHTHKSLLERKPPRRPRYNVSEMRRLISWLFPGNARDRRPTLRFMVTNLTTCYHEPAEPGPTRYFPRHHLLEYNISPLIVSQQPNPHLFLRASCVPEKLMSLVPRHISMDPAPGRYEIRYPFVCPCHSKLLLMPGLRLYVDRQKRNRFRKLPYDRIKERLYCDPEWRHVKGHGFMYLFKMHRRHVTDLKFKATVKESENLRLKLHHDHAYISMINDPDRTPLGRTEPMIQLPMRFKYNILSKRVIRKQLRSNKKIAFGSGQERWKDGYRLPILTYAQQQAAKATLPIERQLCDLPVTTRSFSQIHTKLFQTPKHMLPNYVPELRKRLFKFLPLPGAKVLVTEQDTRPTIANGKYLCDNFYGKEINAENYFQDGITRRRTGQEEEAERKFVAEVQQGALTHPVAGTPVIEASTAVATEAEPPKTDAEEKDGQENQDSKVQVN